MEKLVYDIIPRNQRSNPKGFRLLVKLKFNKATRHLTTLILTQQAIASLPHIDTCKHPRFALDSPSTMFSFSSSRLFPSWFFPPSKPPFDNVMDEHTPSTKRQKQTKTMTARAKRQKVSSSFDDVTMKDAAPSVDNVSQSSK